MNLRDTRRVWEYYAACAHFCRIPKGHGGTRELVFLYARVRHAPFPVECCSCPTVIKYRLIVKKFKR